jgi:hypothetical protein
MTTCATCKQQQISETDEIIVNGRVYKWMKTLSKEYVRSRRKEYMKQRRTQKRADDLFRSQRLIEYLNSCQTSSCVQNDI